jgi:alkylation response protein AidB-like acyl-CoA dehydrogenase
LREEILGLAQSKLSPGARDRDRTATFSRELWNECGKLKLQGLVIPVEDGGRGLHPSDAADALESLGYGCTDGGLAFAICAHMLACAVPVWKHGTESLRKRLLPGLSDGSIIAANAMSEPGSGSDAFALETTAVQDGDGYRLTGRKTFVSNAPVADLFITYAATDRDKGFHGGITAFVVPANAAGLVRQAPVGKTSLRTCQMSDVAFADVHVSDENVIGEAGGGAAIFAESMEWERTLMSALHVGTMQRILEESVAYAKRRKSGGKAIGKHQAVSSRIADMKVRVEAARSLVRAAASKLGRTRDAGLDAAIAKLFTSEALLAAAADQIRTLGGYGVMDDGDAERMLRDAIAATVYSGTSDIQRNIIARWIGL